MLNVTRELIANAIDSGYLSPDYTLHGHRQVRDTACPGDALFNEIKTWPHFGEGNFKNPHSIFDLNYNNQNIDFRFVQVFYCKKQTAVLANELSLVQQISL